MYRHQSLVPQVAHGLHALGIKDVILHHSMINLSMVSQAAALAEYATDRYIEARFRDWLNIPSSAEDAKK